MPLNSRPSVVDNQGTHHGEALRYLLIDTPAKHPLAVGTGYVTLDGLHLLAETVNNDRSVRLLLGAAPRPGLDAALPTQRFTDQLAALRGERDFSRFPPSRAAARLRKVDAFLAQDNVEVRRYTSTFLHGKAYLLGNAADGRAALVSSANLTGPGMWSNLELGLADYNPPVVSAAISWFDRLWESASEYKADLRALLFPSPPIVTPEDVYLRALLELYGDELFATDVAQPLEQHVDLADFQRAGFMRARQIIARHGGVIYADGVGTGKTAIGLAMIEEYALRQGVHALVVAPAQLRGMWKSSIDKARLPAQVVSYQELISDEQIADPGRVNLRRSLNVTKDGYRLVVVDEAHALRNADNSWYRAMTRLLGGSHKDVLLLTATPINNTLWDLYNLVMLFTRHDRALVQVGIDSIRAPFLAAGANTRDFELLDPDRLFPLADAISVRRDRSFIVANYPGAVFSDGTPVRFPTPVLRTRRYSIDDAWPGLVARVSAAIGALSMARYRPSAYECGTREQAGEASLAGLLQSAVLKRFESCWAACLATVRRMVDAHEAFLAGWHAGIVPSLEALRFIARREAEAADIGGWLAEIEEDGATRPVEDFDPGYRDAVADDLENLRAIEAALGELSPDNDPKLALLASVLREFGGKVCVFASYADTVRYIDNHLDAALGAVRERVTVIGTETNPTQTSAPACCPGSRQRASSNQDTCRLMEKSTCCCLPMSSPRGRIFNRPDRYCQNLESAWRLAVVDIVGEHNRRADPTVAEERLPASQRFALSVLRDPSVALPVGAEQADELLSVPRSAAVRGSLSDTQRALSARRISRNQAAEQIVSVVREFGLTPVPPPPPLEPITDDQVGVVCWMRVLPQT